jgi:hypothetical protein
VKAANVGRFFYASIYKNITTEAVFFEWCLNFRLHFNKITEKICAVAQNLFGYLREFYGYDDILRTVSPKNIEL